MAEQAETGWRAAAAAATHGPWPDDLLSRHAARYPRMGAADVYKLLHQATMGPGHAIDQDPSARRRLQEEAAALTRRRPWPDDPLADPLTPERGLGRVHLAPWLRSGRSLDILLAAFVETAASWRPDPARLAEALAAAARWARRRRSPATASELAALVADLAPRGFPPVHHSPAYRNAYLPAYRVVDLALPIMESTIDALSGGDPA